VTETLPERFRGLLEVDVLTCTGCQALRARLSDRRDPDLDRQGGQDPVHRAVRHRPRQVHVLRFCVEACPVDAQAPGDQEITHAIRFTREFEERSPISPR